MRGIEAYLESFIIETRLLNARFEFGEASPVGLRAQLLTMDLGIERSDITDQRSLSILLISGHRPGDVHSSTLKSIEQRAAFGAFCISKSIAIVPLIDQQLNHRVVRRYFVLEEMLLLLFSACYPGAQLFNSSNCISKGLASLIDPVEG